MNLFLSNVRTTNSSWCRLVSAGTVCMISHNGGPAFSHQTLSQNCSETHPQMQNHGQLTIIGASLAIWQARLHQCLVFVALMIEFFIKLREGSFKQEGPKRSVELLTLLNEIAVLLCERNRMSIVFHQADKSLVLHCSSTVSFSLLSHFHLTSFLSHAKRKVSTSATPLSY